MKLGLLQPVIEHVFWAFTLEGTVQKTSAKYNWVFVGKHPLLTKSSLLRNPQILNYELARWDQGQSAFNIPPRHSREGEGPASRNLRSL